MCIYFEKPNDMSVSNAIRSQPNGLTSLRFPSLRAALTSASDVWGFVCSSQASFITQIWIYRSESSPSVPNVLTPSASVHYGDSEVPNGKGSTSTHHHERVTKVHSARGDE